MIPSKHSRSLYFTPRTPWGRLPQNRPGQSQNYLRASENETDDSIHLAKGVYAKPEIDDKNAEGKTEVKVDVGRSFHFPWEVKQMENDKLRQENNAREHAKAMQWQQSGAAGAGAGAGKTPPVNPAPDKVVLHGASQEYVDQRNKAYQDSLRKSGFDPTGKILFVKG